MKLAISVSFLLLSLCLYGQTEQIIYGDGRKGYAGSDLAISGNGNKLAIGGWGNGSVKVYVKNNAIWDQIGSDIELDEDSGDYEFRGLSLTENGDRLAMVVAIRQLSGQAIRVYDLKEGTWEQVGSDIVDSLYIPSGDDKYVRELSISGDGNRVAVGASEWTPNGGSLNARGKVLVYEFISEEWERIVSFQGEVDPEQFGEGLAISYDGKVIAAGASRGKDTINFSGRFDYPGYVKVFQEVEGSWIQMGEQLSGKVSADRFGQAVDLSLDGRTMAVGAHRRYNNQGEVTIYRWDGKSWNLLGSGVEGPVKGPGGFGSWVSLSGEGDRFVSASYDTVFIFDWHGDEWVETNSIDPISEADSRTARLLALSHDGNTLAIPSSFARVQGTIGVGFVRILDGLRAIVSADDISLKNILIYPNPAHDLLNFEGFLFEDVTIIDLSGRMVYKSPFSSRINIGFIPDGWYILKFRIGNSFAIHKIIKN